MKTTTAKVFAAINSAPARQLKRPGRIKIGKEETASAVSDPGHNSESGDTSEVLNKIRDMEAYSAPLLSTHESIRRKYF